MNKENFLEKLIEVIEAEDTVDQKTELSSIEEWDSLAAVATLALFKKELGLNIKSADIADCKSIQDIIDLGEGSYE